VPGDVNLWPQLTGGEAVDLLGRLRGGLDPARRADPDRALRARPYEEGPHVLEGEEPAARLVSKRLAHSRRISP
jgi:ABC-2 type transport system ATP-binding protein